MSSMSWPFVPITVTVVWYLPSPRDLVELRVSLMSRSNETLWATRSRWNASCEMAEFTGLITWTLYMPECFEGIWISACKYIWFFHAINAQVVWILCRWRQGQTYLTLSALWLLMTWLCKAVGHFSWCFSWNFPNVNATRPDWLKSNIGSYNGLLPHGLIK